MSKYVKKGYMEMSKWIYLEPPRRIHWVHQVALFYTTIVLHFFLFYLHNSFIKKMLICVHIFMIYIKVSAKIDHLEISA